MQIVENTDERLVIEHRPWILAGLCWLMGLAALHAGITGRNIDGFAQRLLVLALGAGVSFAAWYWFAFLRIAFDRATGRVEHRAIRPFGSRSRILLLSRILSARVEAHWDSDGARLTRLVLETEDGRVPLEYGYGNGERRGLETAVNEWLTRPV